LTFCTQIVAGDSWGRETVPIIESFPAAGLIFAAVYLSVGMALLNLILGVVVNVATEERERIAKQLAEEKKLQRKEAHDHLRQMCIDMDEDGNEELTFEEIQRGFDSNDLFRSTLEKMDIGRDDLDIVWSILDSDKSGTVTAKEFATQIYHLKSSETQFLLAYIRFYITEIKHSLRAGQEKLKDDLRHGQQDLHQNLAHGQEALVTKLRSGQEELQKKLRAGQEELQRKLRSGQEDLQQKLRGGQQELRKSLRAGQEKLRLDLHKGLGIKTKFEELEQEADIEVEKLRSSPPIDSLKEPTPTVRSFDPAGALQAFVELVHPHTHNEIGQCKKSTKEGDTLTNSNDEYVERLAELHQTWQQCLVVIDDVHDRQSDLSSLLATQAKCLVSVIQCTPGSRDMTELAI